MTTPEPAGADHSLRRRPHAPAATPAWAIDPIPYRPGQPVTLLAELKEHPHGPQTLGDDTGAAPAVVPGWVCVSSPTRLLRIPLLSVLRDAVGSDLMLPRLRTGDLIIWVRPVTPCSGQHTHGGRQANTRCLPWPVNLLAPAPGRHVPADQR